MTPDMSIWTGRVDAGEGELARRWHQQVAPFAQGLPKGVGIIGFACDEGVRRNQGRVGAAAAPQTLRKALANLAWHQAQPLCDKGDVACTDGDLAAAHQRLADAVRELMCAGHFPLVLGGGHETAFGTWSGLAAAAPDQVIGIINFDAHFDIREAAEATSGTPFAQIAAECQRQDRPFHYLCLGVAEPSNTRALFARAETLGVQWLLDSQLTAADLPAADHALQSFIDKVDIVYLTIDLDVLPASVMPAVSAPAAMGVELPVVEALCRRIAASGKLAAADLVELNPHFDIDGHGAKTAARLAWTLTRHLAR
ncbi:formimidoylglutamase [uncultured Aquitalea sp.]|uniref:formimidoylglutamase n=1 Tax=uncultured Aquitalea sp. TaxID=540272 RepID=UPI0025E5A7EE|nr:formimidoylglutamase [uncultured Aquitalea sp.]